MTLGGISESLIENEIGCGPFQVVIVVFIFILVKLSSLYTFVFMSYGNYNPGWRCLDNGSYSLANATYSNGSSLTQPTVQPEYERELSCDAFEACQLVEFNPESSTIVTEWNLVCDRAWISSLIISIQMAGTFVGSIICGQMADSLGRKKTLYGSLLFASVVTGLSVLSPSWQVFSVFRFFNGMACTFYDSLNYIYPSEFVVRKWRGPLSGIPGWSIAGILFGITCMVFKDWTHVLLTTSGVCFLSFIPVLWVPESLRWLEVKNKKKEFDKVAGKMAKLNNKTVKGIEEIQSNMEQQTPGFKETNNKKYTLIDVFRPGYRLISIIIGFVWLSMALIFYAIGFGIKALSGNFYLNLILIYALLFPFSVFPLFASNILGRKKASCLFISLAAVGLIIATIFEVFTEGNFRMIATLVLVLCAEVSVDTTWCIQQVMTSEIYPTVVRGLGINWGSLMARIGGIIAPFLIPKDSETVYIWYLVMGSLGFVCCGLLTRLPETRGKPLKDTFDDVMEMTVNTDEEVVKEKLTRADKESESKVDGECENDNQMFGNLIL